jgi:uncharacterized membrane protein
VSSLLLLPEIRRLYELGLPLLFALSSWRSWKLRGGAAVAREMGFGFALSQSVELLAVWQGRYRYPDWLVYFPPTPAWVPLGVGLGWAALVPVVMTISQTLLGDGANRWKLAALDGALAVGMDLILDPAVSGEPLRMWMWTGEKMTPYKYWLLGVPVFNFVGWFLLIGASGLQLRAAATRRKETQWAWLVGFLFLDLALAALVMRLPW